MSQPAQHVYQVRDIVAMLLEKPQDSECVVTIGGTTQFINKVSIQSDHRRRVCLNTSGEDRIAELEDEIVEVEEEGFRNEALLEKFDKIMSDDISEAYRVALLKDLHIAVEKELNED